MNIELNCSKDINEYSSFYNKNEYKLFLGDNITVILPKEDIVKLYNLLKNDISKIKQDREISLEYSNKFKPNPPSPPTDRFIKDGELPTKIKS